MSSYARGFPVSALGAHDPLESKAVTTLHFLVKDRMNTGDVMILAERIYISQKTFTMRRRHHVSKTLGTDLAVSMVQGRSSPSYQIESKILTT